jgi:translation initiation factor IF-1
MTAGDGQSEREKPRSVQGTVREALQHAMFTIQLESGDQVTAHIGGELKTTLVRLVPGDTVTVELSPYDLSRGRIVRKNRAVM